MNKLIPIAMLACFITGQAHAGWFSSHDEKTLPERMVEAPQQAQEAEPEPEQPEAPEPKPLFKPGDLVKFKPSMEPCLITSMDDNGAPFTYHLICKEKDVNIQWDGSVEEFALSP